MDISGMGSGAHSKWDDFRDLLAVVAILGWPVFAVGILIGLIALFVYP